MHQDQSGHLKTTQTQAVGEMGSMSNRKLKMKMGFKKQSSAFLFHNLKGCDGVAAEK